MMSPADLLERLVHGNGEATADVHTETPKEVLDALEWSDADSGKDLVERANGLSRSRSLSPPSSRGPNEDRPVTRASPPRSP
jgi:hypothetical protein